MGGQLITEDRHDRSLQHASGREHYRKMTCDLKCNSQKSSSLSSCRGRLVLFQRCRCTRAAGSRELKRAHPASSCFPTTQPGPPASAAPSDGWAHAYAGIASPRLPVALPPAALQLSRAGCPRAAHPDTLATATARAPAVLHWCSV